MQIWDTAGQERYHSMQGVFFHGADGCVLVFDLTNTESFNQINKWKKQFIETVNVKNISEFPFVLVGNKSDLAFERKVPQSVQSR